ncbi:ArsR/SmtB family transcription factor [Campylobacter ureolyticus]|uniref:Metalloregulator ArsR/SmtB family transcription factor n=1 Tax=Campylobacter ureolyticus TaxID=827 RepID=A0A9Q4KP32_9BACT|nr:metalloregulator ArsR/SmtB family transcription factor [Campylobacter ureolyticus]MCZ6104875.1 metalloregulator ArsR/SmtB family transcription factor [Campylobacter ureolyticus]MCZ6111195.1 metalloregulator ArsR/SmtB family transcription factor [Campylobacter ureolyticus]MCZ6157490.1 metalloregulator ArsR/SmtB family transcription factor [Campylobacter ureolyticus]MCZ6160174.1 metalloregulator ArsR/SmtB family transcription factor [Campylobacter ureolyticus]MCZ6163909.1 metalloregulator Ars
MDKKEKILEDDQEICESVVIHKEVVENTKIKMPDDTSLNELADFFKIFGDSTRVRILWALSLNQMCVCDIATLLNMSQSSISHQLRVLKQNKFVKNRRDGKVVYYSLLDEHISYILKQGLTHISE